MKSILITGVAGFIGSHLARRWMNMGYKVIGIDNFCTSNKINIDHFPNEKFVFFKHDVCEPWPKELVESSERPEYIFHLASPAAVNQYSLLNLETMAVNSVGLERVLKWAQPRKSRVIFASTSEIYGSPRVHPQPENYWGDVNSFGVRSCYDEGKRFGEALIYNWNLRYQTRHGLVRIFNTYGPGMNPMDGRVCFQFLQKALQNLPILIYGNGQQSRSFCYIDDLIDGLILYSRSGLAEPINLGNDQEITVKQLADVVIQLTRSKSSIQYIAPLADDPPHRRPDLTKARSLLGFRPKISIEEGLSRFIHEMISTESEIQNNL